MNDIFVIKKNGALEPFSNEKIIKAVNKAQARVDVELTKAEQDFICSYVVKKIEDNCPEIEGQIRMGVYELHPIVEEALEQVNKKVAKSYKEYRDYKKQNNEMLETILSENETLETEGNRDNANADSRLITTKRFLEGCALSKASYQRFYLSPKEVQANNDGYIYIHDLALRKYTFNCCVANFQNILTGGFKMGSIHYVEPKTLPAFFNVSGDITLSASSQQYGGFSIPEFDTLSAKYAKLSFDKYFEEEKTNTEKKLARKGLSLTEEDIEDCCQTALDKVRADYRQGFQGLECMLNSCANAKGDYSFVSLSFGLGEGIFEQMATEEILKVRMEGQGPKGHKKPVLFPKLIFLYDEKKHAEGRPLHHLFLMARDCSCVCMYPDYFNVRQVEEETARNYEKYGKAVTPMGCRSAVSPFYESGNYTQVDENDIPVTQGRFNIGVVSLNLPMILAKARKNKKDFYQVLDYYLDIIRGIHKKTRAQLSKLKASSNPLMFMEGGLWHGNLQANDTIEPIMKAATASFGITALNELQRLYNGKSLTEDNQFALEVSQYIYNKLKEFKAEDGIAYSIYGTPAESLCFSGDTLVQTSKGNKPIKDVKIGDLVYSYNENTKKIELKPVVNSLCTGKNRQVVKVKFDTGQEIICTPNHPFAVRTMKQDEIGRILGEEIEYVEAINLKPNMRIKSNYIQMHGNYLETSDNQYLHHLIYKHYKGDIPEGYVIHHKDGNKLNNDISNLVLLSSKEHRILHLKDTIKPYTFTSEKCKGEKNHFYGRKHTEEAKEKNRLAHLGKSPTNKIQLDEVNLTKDYYSGLSFKELGQKYNVSSQVVRNRLIKLGCHQVNHQVVSVETLNERIDVYDITVQDNHNFYVGGNEGILVHNCGKQVLQFRNKYGIIEGVSDRDYFSNSFHCHVSENITPIEKQKYEEQFWPYFSGGRIQYNRISRPDINKDAVLTCIKEAMKRHFYYGVNFPASYCEKCGKSFTEPVNYCPHCGSPEKFITTYDRVCGYLGQTRVAGDTRLNKAKLCEIKDRKSM